jgi:hypothetical protein
MGDALHTVWLTKWRELDGEAFVQVTLKDYFMGHLSWQKGGGWKFDPRPSACGCVRSWPRTGANHA